MQIILSDADAALLAKIEAFLTTSGIKPSRFGLDTMKDGALVAQLRAGRSLSLRNAEKILDHIARQGFTKDEAP